MVSAPQPPEKSTPPNKVVTKSKRIKDSLSLQFLIEGNEQAAELRHCVKSVESHCDWLEEYADCYWAKKTELLNSSHLIIRKVRRLEI